MYSRKVVAIVRGSACRKGMDYFTNVRAWEGWKDVPQHIQYEHNLCDRNETDHHPTGARARERGVGRSRRLCHPISIPDKDVTMSEKTYE